jgi:hypothetical protein
MSKPKFEDTLPVKPKFEETTEVPEAAEPEEELTITDYAGRGLQGVGKTLDYLRGGVTAPAVAAILEQLSGNDVYNFKEHMNALNPLSLDVYPDGGEIMKRAGVPEGGKLSDVVPGYADPAKNPSWYEPEKGGLLDPSTRGTGGFAFDTAIDPLTYISMGTHKIAGEALKKSPSYRVFNKSQDGLIKSVAKAAAKKSIGLQMAPLMTPTTAALLVDELGRSGKVLKNLATWPSDAVKNFGDHLYSSMLQPLEHEGRVFKKKEVAQSFYNAKIKSPLNLRAKVDEATNKLIAARDQILNSADAAGAELNMRKATLAAQKEVQRLRAIGSADADKLAENLEENIKDLVTRAEGKPAIPEKSHLKLEQQGPANQYGHKKYYHSKVVTQPAVPEVPKQPYNTKKGTALKSFLYQGTPGSVFHENLNAPVAASVKNKLTMGIKEEVEDATARAIGPRKAAELSELNDEAGKFLSTRKAQTRVSNQQERNMSNMQNLTGMDTWAGGVGVAHGDIEGGAKAILAKKFLDGLRLLTMPGGYYLQKLADSSTIAPVMDAYGREKFKQKTIRKDQDEQEE